jgi:hypothetical protein
VKARALGVGMGKRKLKDMGPIEQTKQANKHANRHANKQTSKQASKQTNTQANRHASKHADGRAKSSASTPSRRSTQRSVQRTDGCDERCAAWSTRPRTPPQPRFHVQTQTNKQHKHRTTKDPMDRSDQREPHVVYNCNICVYMYIYVCVYV